MERQGTNERPDPDTTPPGVRVTGEGKVVDGFHKIAEPRQTGRTTQLLKEAVKKLEEGKNVVFVIKLWSDITHVQHMLDKAGLLPGLNLTQSGRYTHKDGNTLTIISLSDATSMCFKEREACVIYDHTIDLNDRATEKTELPKEANEIKQQYCDVEKVCERWGWNKRGTKTLAEWLDKRLSAWIECITPSDGDILLIHSRHPLTQESLDVLRKHCEGQGKKVAIVHVE